MANIKYMSNQKQLPGSTFDSDNSTIFEIEQNIAQLQEKLDNQIEKLRETLYRNHTLNKEEINERTNIKYFTISEYDKNKKKTGYILHVNENDANKHLAKIMKEASKSSPFDEKILKENNVKAIDGIKIRDFKSEDTFRECLEHYYYILWFIHDIESGYDAIIKKMKYKIKHSPLPNDFFDYFNYNNETILTQKGKIKYLITNYSAIEIEYIIENEILKYYYRGYDVTKKEFTEEELNEIESLLNNSPIAANNLLIEIYDGDYDDPRPVKIKNLLKIYTFNNLKNLINDIEQKIIDKKIKKMNLKKY